MTEEDKLLRRRFFAFLKEHDAYDKWVYNFMKQHPMNDIEWWDYSYQSIYKRNCFFAISRSFCWSDTKEGYEFWSKLEYKWNKLISSLIE